MLVSVAQPLYSFDVVRVQKCSVSQFQKCSIFFFIFSRYSLFYRLFWLRLRCHKVDITKVVIMAVIITIT